MAVAYSGKLPCGRPIRDASTGQISGLYHYRRCHAALGIAVNATMFSLVSAFFLPHLPGHDPQSMVVVSSVNPDTSFYQTPIPSLPNYSASGKNISVFSAVTAENEFLTGSLSGSAQQPEAISYSAVSTNYFSVFGVSPQLGRASVSGEDVPGHDHILILSYGLWNAGSGRILDRWTVGAPEQRGLRGGRCDAAVFACLGSRPNSGPAHPEHCGSDAQWPQESLSVHVCQVRARHYTPTGTCADRPSATAQHDFPDTQSRWGASVRALPDFLIHDFGIGTALAMIMTVVGFVLLIACANVRACC